MIGKAQVTIAIYDPFAVNPFCPIRCILGHGQGITGIMHPGASCRQHNGQHQEHQVAYQLAVALRDLLMRDDIFAHMVSNKRFVVHNRAEKLISRGDPQFPRESGVVHSDRYGQRAE